MGVELMLLRLELLSAPCYPDHGPEVSANR
jgi:hypothetical protein